MDLPAFRYKLLHAVSTRITGAKWIFNAVDFCV